MDEVLIFQISKKCDSSNPERGHDSASLFITALPMEMGSKGLMMHWMSCLNALPTRLCLSLISRNSFDSNSNRSSSGVHSGKIIPVASKFLLPLILPIADSYESVHSWYAKIRCCPSMIQILLNSSGIFIMAGSASWLIPILWKFI